MPLHKASCWKMPHFLHRPPVQVLGGGHFTLQSPQCSGLKRVRTHPSPGQKENPEPQAHMPRSQSAWGVVHSERFVHFAPMLPSGPPGGGVGVGGGVSGVGVAVGALEGTGTAASTSRRFDEGASVAVAVGGDVGTAVGAVVGMALELGSGGVEGAVIGGVASGSDASGAFPVRRSGRMITRAAAPPPTNSNPKRSPKTSARGPTRRVGSCANVGCAATTCCGGDCCVVAE